MIYLHKYVQVQDTILMHKWRFHQIQGQVFLEEMVKDIRIQDQVIQGEILKKNITYFVGTPRDIIHRLWKKTKLPKNIEYASEASSETLTKTNSQTLLNNFDAELHKESFYEDEILRTQIPDKDYMPSTQLP